MSNPSELIIKQAIESWSLQLKQFNKILNEISDESLITEIAPNCNRGIYILGHMVAVHDRICPLLNFGDQAFPELNGPFLNERDNNNANYPTIPDLRSKWNAVNVTLHDHFIKLSPEEWMQRHTAVSEEDFAKEPHRNRLNVLLSRTNHISYHAGQLVLLKNKTKELV